MNFALRFSIAVSILLFISYEIPAQTEIEPGLTLFQNDSVDLRKMIIDHNNNIWCGSYSSGIYKFDGSTWIHFTPFEGMGYESQILALAINNNGDIWMDQLIHTLGEAVLFKFDGHNWHEFNGSNTPLPTHQGDYLDQIRNIAFDSHNNTWINMNNHGLYKYNGVDWTHYAYDDNDDMRFANLYVDQNDIIWLLPGNFFFGGVGPLIKFDGDTTWTTFENLQGEATILTSDTEGNIWYCNGNVLYKFNGVTQEIINQDGDLWEGRIGGIDFDSEGNFYINAIGDEIIKFIGGNPDESGNYYHYPYPSTTGNIIIDGDNFIWFAMGWPPQLYRLDDTPQIKLNSPDGSQNFQYKDIVSINWEGYFFPDTKVEFTVNDGDNWAVIAVIDVIPLYPDQNISNYYQTYDWEVPLVVPFSDQCRIKVSNADDLSCFDESENFTIYAKVKTPTLSHTSGYYQTAIQVSISCATADAQIYYSIDGSTPTTNSYLYTSPIIIDRNMTLKTRAYEEGYVESDIQSVQYEIEPAAMQVNFATDSIWLDADYNGLASGIIDAGGSTISYGEISTYAWSLNDSIISTESSVSLELPTGSTDIICTITSNLGAVKSDTCTVTVSAAALKTNGAIISGVSQLNEDLFFTSSTDDKIYAFDSTGTVEWVIATGGDIQSTICVSNENDIYVGSSDTRLYAFDYLGFPKWDKPMGGVIVSSPSIGPDSTVYVGITSGRLFAVSRAGTILWGLQTGGPITSSAAIDGQGVIYFGSNDGKIYAVQSTGDTLWAYSTGAAISSSPALDTDSTIVIGSGDGFLYKLDASGNLIWRFNTGGAIVSSPVTGSDGTIIIGSAGGHIFKIDDTGHEQWRYDTGVSVSGTAAISNQGVIYIGLDDGRFVSLSSGGEFLWSLQTGAPVVAPPLVTQNNLIYIGSTDRTVYILKDPMLALTKRVASSPSLWPTFKGNNRRTGFIGVAGQEPQPEPEPEPKIPDHYSLSQNYPNPFNPATRIKYDLPTAGHVTIEIYNVNGQKIATLVDQFREAGSYEVAFSGQYLSSGIYFYRIQAGVFEQVKKMILVR